MSLDNSALVRPFIPPTFDGDTFCYTELLDRGKRKGNNGFRILKTYFHRSREEFDTQLPHMQRLCDLTKVRAYTRLAQRSYKKVAKEFVRLVVETYTTENFSGMKTLYARACGIVSPNVKMWMLDIDEKTFTTNVLKERLRNDGHLLAVIPSRKGEHFIIRAFDARAYTQPGILNEHNQPIQGWESWGQVSLHKDNGTNLYIPDEAD